MCVEQVEDGSAYVGTRVMIVLVTGVHGGDGEDFFARVRNLGTIGAIVVHNEPSWKFGDGRCGDVPVEGPSVN